MFGNRLKERGGLGTNIGLAVIAQGISLLSSVMMSLVVPKALGVEDYAYWQLFTLYVGYVGLLLLGVHDGAFLRLGGILIGRIDWSRIKTQFVIVLVFQMASLLGVAFVALSCSGLQARTIVLLFVVADGLIVNPASFLFYVLRAANLPNIYSSASMLSGGAWAILLVILTILSPDSFLAYAFGYLICQTLAAGFCYFHISHVFNCAMGSLHEGLRDCKGDCLAGLKVTLAYYAGTLVVGSCRMLIDYKWGIEAFGLFSFSVSLVNFLLSFMAQVSMVIFPVVRRMEAGSQNKVYLILRNSLVTVLPLVYVLYFPGRALLGWWLPQYADSLRYLAIMLPVCIFDCKMQLLVNTYLKSMRKENSLMWMNIVSLGGAVVLMSAVAFCTSSITVTAAAMVVAIAMRSVVAEVYLGRFMNVGSKKVLVSEVVLALLFVLVAYVFADAFLVIAAVALFYYVNFACVKNFATTVSERVRRCMKTRM